MKKDAFDHAIECLRACDINDDVIVRRILEAVQKGDTMTIGEIAYELGLSDEE